MLIPKKRPWPVFHIEHKSMTEEEMKSFDECYVKDCCTDEEMESMIKEAIKSGKKVQDAWIDKNGNVHFGPVLEQYL